MVVGVIVAECKIAPAISRCIAHHSVSATHTTCSQDHRAHISSQDPRALFHEAHGGGLLRCTQGGFGVRGGGGST